MNAQLLSVFDVLYLLLIKELPVSFVQKVCIRKKNGEFNEQI